MKIKELIKLSQGIDVINKIMFDNNKTNYWISKMKNKIDLEKKNYQETLNKNLIAIDEEFFQREEDGTYKTKTIPATPAILATETSPEIPEVPARDENILVEGKTVEELVAKRNEAYKTLDELEVEFDFNKIKLSDLDKPIHPEVLNNLSEIIEE
jgi:hypothetical protein